MIKQNMLENRNNNFRKFGVRCLALLIMLGLVLCAIPVKADASNPELDESCGINIVLVLDSSDSLNTGEIQQVKDAATAFVTSLSGTPTNFGVVDFDTQIVSFLALTNDISAVTAAINSIGHNSSTELTNWHAAITEAKNLLNTPSPKQDLMVIITDGDPTTYGYPTSQGRYGGYEPDPNDINYAIQAADSAKTAGIRILAIGVTTSPTVSNLIDISGPNVNTGDLTSDVITTGISNLADTLANLASQLCGGTITVQKFVDGETAKDWEFTIDVIGGTADPPFGFTDDDGFIVFDISINPGNTTAYVNITEIQQGGYSFVDAIARDCSGQICTDNGVDSLLGIPVTQDGCPITCVFNNTDVNSPPIFGIPIPANGSTVQNSSFVWSIPISDPENDTFNWSIKCDGQINSSNNDNNGTKEISLTGLAYNTTYTVGLNAKDAYGTTEEWFIFKTADNQAPIQSNEFPSNNEVNVDNMQSSISVYIADPNWDLMNWTIKASTGNNNSSSSDVGDGTISCDLTTPLSYDANVIWYVNITDGFNWTNKTYSFIVESAPSGDDDDDYTGDDDDDYTRDDDDDTDYEMNQPPVADASEGEPYEGLVDEEITLDGSNSYDPDGEIVEWFWDFDDDTVETGEVITHSYSDPGIYFVELMVTDDDGATDYYETSVVINQPNRPPTNPVVNDSISTGKPNTKYIFTVVSTDPDGDDIRYIVDWGDETYDETGYIPNGSMATLNHTWTSMGIYNVNVSAVDENNAASGITELEITIDKEAVETSTLNFTMILLLAMLIVGLLLASLEYLRRKKGSNNTK